jgi:hypothetical protein
MEQRQLLDSTIFWASDQNSHLRFENNGFPNMHATLSGNIVTTRGQVLL